MGQADKCFEFNAEVIHVHFSVPCAPVGLPLTFTLGCFSPRARETCDGAGHVQSASVLRCGDLASVCATPCALLGRAMVHCMARCKPAASLADHRMLGVVQRLPGVGSTSSALDDRWLFLLVLFGCRGSEW